MIALPLTDICGTATPDPSRRRVFAGRDSSGNRHLPKPERLERHAAKMRTENAANIHMREAQRKAWQKRRTMNHPTPPAAIAGRAGNGAQRECLGVTKERECN